MSDHLPIPEETEHVRGRPIAWLLGGTVLAIVACGVVVWTLQIFQLSGGGRTNVQHLDLALPAQPFSTATTRERARAADRLQLDRWIWLDRATGRVRMPVDAAIDRYLGQRRIP